MSEHTPTPWVINQHNNHAAGDLWLSIGYVLPDGTTRGPIAEMAGTKAALYQPVCEFKYLATPDDEQRANAELIVRAVNAHDELAAALEIVLASVWYRPQVADEAFQVSLTVAQMDQIQAALAKARGES